MSSHPQVRLVGATVALLRALDEDRARFGELIGSPVPEGWPEFPEAIAFTLEHLKNAPEADRGRWGCAYEVVGAGRLVARIMLQETGGSSTVSSAPSRRAVVLTSGRTRSGSARVFAAKGSSSCSVWTATS